MRTFLATILGLVVAISATKGIEILGHNLFPVELDISPTNVEELKLIMFKLPPHILAIVIIAHSLGLLFGIIVSRFIDKKSILPLYYICGLMILLAVINLLMIQHPLWFIITDITSLLIIATLFIRSASKSNS